MTIPEFKRFRIGIIAEFRRIPSGFPNQAKGLCVKEESADDNMNERHFQTFDHSAQ
jgi:hypothetical protein